MSKVQMLASVLQSLEISGARYCILHGYRDLDHDVLSDIDCIIEGQYLPNELVKILLKGGHEVVQHLRHESTSHYLVISDGCRAPSDLLALDASADYRRNGSVFYSEDDFLQTRRRFRSFWVPSTNREFGYYLVKKIAKGSLEPNHGSILSQLYAKNPRGCRDEIGRFWSGSSLEDIERAARLDEWTKIRRTLPQLRRELLIRTSLDARTSILRFWLHESIRIVHRLTNPTGLHVVFLGPDGAGKSTTIAAIEHNLTPAFRGTSVHHLFPRLWRRASRYVGTTNPHSRRVRSMPASLAKMVYWSLEFTAGYLIKVRPSLIRSRLVLFDRYFPDIIVDPLRYRYGGPSWLTRVIWKILPKPDLVILLDAPVEVLHERKQEVSIEETRRQTAAYRELVTRMPNGHIVNAARPRPDIVLDVTTIIIDHLARRTSQRLGIFHSDIRGD